MCGCFFHHEHLACIPMKALFNDGDIDIDDIAFLENLGVAGDAVANDVIYRGADRFRKTVIIQWRGNGLLHINDVVVTDFVQFSSADTCFYERAYHLEDFGGEASGNAHLGDVFRRFDADGHSVEVLLYTVLSVLFAVGHCKAAGPGLTVAAGPALGPVGECLTEPACHSNALSLRRFVV